jgi:hypothetical protein
MLNDDIKGWFRKTGTGIGDVISNALNGATTFALTALVITAIVYLLTPVILGMSLSSAGTAFMYAGLPIVELSTLAGALIMGVASLLPGKAEGANYRKIAGTQINRAQGLMQQAALAPQRVQQQPVKEMPNYAYQEGRGAKALAQSEAAQGTGVARC